jgi:nucleoside diphosphate kinase
MSVRERTFIMIKPDGVQRGLVNPLLLLYHLPA